MTASAIRLRRSVLYLPASNTRAIEKARGLAADVVILDLEDAVAPDAKEQAREAAMGAVAQGGFVACEVAVRANGLDTPWGADDLAAVAASQADAVLVPKVSTPDDVAQYDAALATAHARMELWTMIETCRAVTHLDALAALSASTRLSLWVMGVNDLAKEMRARITPNRAAFVSILSLAVCAARAHGVAIIDSVCNEFRDLDLFRAEALQGAQFGFDGKSLIHPAQIEPCNAVFSPSADEVGFARAVIAAFDLPENRGKGTISVEGKMAELLHLYEARRTVAMAELAANHTDNA